MKKLFLLTFAVAIAIATFAVPISAGENWNGKRQMAVTMSIIHPLLTGALGKVFCMDIGFEYAPVPSAAVKVNLRYEHDRFFRVSAEGRWYPQENYLNGWFVGSTLQFQHIFKLSHFLWDTTEEVNHSVNIFSVFIGTGYKAIFGSERTAFAIEPAVDFGWPVALGRFIEYPYNYDFSPWMAGVGGLRFKVPIGVAF